MQVLESTSCWWLPIISLAGQLSGDASPGWLDPRSVNQGSANLVWKNLWYKLQVELQCTPQGITLWLMRDNVPKSHDSYINWKRDSNTPELKDVPRILWTQCSADVELLRSANPVQIEIKGGKPPSLKQYLLSQEVREGVRPITEDFLQRGILTLCKSPCNIPVFQMENQFMDLSKTYEQ